MTAESRVEQLLGCLVQIIGRAAVKEEFVRILTGMHHHRIDYPASTGGISAEWEAASGT